ncbi:MAG TPA: sugar transferase [Polyangiaceae bacterium]|nr:sugar transferase [Polyangiaceae bacterium]
MERSHLEKLAKRTLDVGVAGIGLVMSLPLLVGVGIAVRRELGSPVLFRQIRPGLKERPFEMIKFRTMCEPTLGQDRLDSDAERMTPLGKFLRASSLDELPTLWNVLKGDMSLVGPRPLLPEYLELYSREQRRRHLVRPGVTGWAVVNGRNALDWDSKFALDVWYVDHWSLGLDLKILAKTVVQILLRTNVVHEGHATMPRFRGSVINEADDSTTLQERREP